MNPNPTTPPAAVTPTAEELRRAIAFMFFESQRSDAAGRKTDRDIYRLAIYALKRLDVLWSCQKHDFRSRLRPCPYCDPYSP